MDSAMKERIEAAGFRETSVQEFLGLTSEENDLLETRLALSRLVKDLREKRKLTQTAVAGQVGSDQANISKAEASDSSVSLDWMVRAAFALGASRKQVGRAISG